MLESEGLKDTWQLTVRFEGVRSFSLDDLGGRPTRISGLEIVEIKDRQWEGLNWQIRDYEEGSIEFFCREIEIRAVTAAGS